MKRCQNESFGTEYDIPPAKRIYMSIKIREIPFEEIQDLPVTIYKCKQNYLKQKQMTTDLQKIYDAQVIIFKMLSEIQGKQKGSSRLAPISSYQKELEEEINKLRKHS